MFSWILGKKIGKVVSGQKVGQKAAEIIYLNCNSGFLKNIKESDKCFPFDLFNKKEGKSSSRNISFEG